jgi:large subunit ribosomal protein L3
VTVRGIIGKKIGTTQFMRDDGALDCATAILAGPCTVTQVKTLEKEGYESVQLGYGPVKRVNKPTRGHLQKAGDTFRYLREFEADDLSDLEVGQQIDASLFEAGEYVDAVGWSKGRGFAGGVKRHGFHGGPKTHGQSDRHRAPGSIGAGSSPGRVIKGHKMAGHMGAARVTVRHLEVLRSDPERNLLFVKGAVPGARNSLVYINKIGRGRK